MSFGWVEILHIVDGHIEKVLLKKDLKEVREEP